MSCVGTRPEAIKYRTICQQVELNLKNTAQLDVQNEELKECLYENYVQQGFSIVSGMAKGIDACAATVCINEGGYTIAVLGKRFTQNILHSRMPNFSTASSLETAPTSTVISFISRGALRSCSVMKCGGLLAVRPGIYSPNRLRTRTL